jgi:hypothetical protein
VSSVEENLVAGGGRQLHLLSPIMHFKFKFIVGQADRSTEVRVMPEFEWWEIGGCAVATCRVSQEVAGGRDRCFDSQSGDKMNMKLVSTCRVSDQENDHPGTSQCCHELTARFGSRPAWTGPIFPLAFSSCGCHGLKQIRASAT